MKKFLATILCSIFILCGTVHALPYVNSYGEYNIYNIGVLGTRNVESDSGYSQAETKIAYTSDNEHVFAHSKFDPDGSAAVEVRQGSNGSDFVETTARGYWEDSYVASTAGFYNYEFTITGGEIAIINYSTTNDYLITNDYTGADKTALLRSIIRLGSDNRLLWGVTNRIVGNDGAYTYLGHKEDIGGVAFYEINNPDGDGGQLAEHYFGVRYEDYSNVLALGYFEAGEEILLKYYLFALTADRPNPDIDEHYTTQMFASIGDPNNLSSGMSGQIVLEGSTDPVPEPATMILFGIGIVGLAGTRLRKKKQ